MKTPQAIVVALLTLVTASTMNAQEIFDAVRNGDMAKVKVLIEGYPQLVKARNARQSTPLHVAVDVDNEPITRYLIEKGADISALNSGQLTPLFSMPRQPAWPDCSSNKAPTSILACRSPGCW
jgi:ankyrin repeat protein